VNIPPATPVPERRKKRNRKGKAAASEDVVMSDVEIAEPGASGTKRALQDSPSKVEVPAKRSRKDEGGSSRKEDSPRTEDRSRAADKGVDLSRYEFDEETAVDLVLVPALLEKVRSGAAARDLWLTGVLDLHEL